MEACVSGFPECRFEDERSLDGNGVVVMSVVRDREVSKLKASVGEGDDSHARRKGSRRGGGTAVTAAVDGCVNGAREAWMISEEECATTSWRRDLLFGSAAWWQELAAASGAMVVKDSR
ncbi:hypothetical protein LR48_Vigan03g116400 [Vigna angularis]|uniref:Uncharacterized protein n=1 Tax=Phaseolus angularis TaxID=3914 RepID=A0A0L9U529_PHAAN|nr:hypothetical protein LR48_Vigan03g116400 [Vigna angularis]